MAYFNEFPHTRTYDADLGWLIRKIKEIAAELDEYISLNSIQFADPINWNIATQYPPLTIVLDASGGAYISRKPVPAGVPLTNEEYWTEIYNTFEVIRSIKTRIAFDNGASDTAEERIEEGSLFWFNDELFRATEEISEGEKIIVGTNCEIMTVDEKINMIASEINVLISDLDIRCTALENATKNKPFLNVLDFGAKGDGVTDDYQSFVNAIAAAASTGYTLIVPNGNYYLSAEPAITELNTGQSLNLLLSYEVDFSGGGAGNPNNPIFNGKLLSPVCNKGNRLRGWSIKSYDKNASPAGNGSTLQSVEWIADTSDDYINVTGSMITGSYTMTLDSVEGVTLGAGVIPVNAITGFPDGATKQNTARVTAIDFSNNTIEIGFPDANPAAWAGIAISSPWNGNSFSNQAFRIRKRAWNVTQFIGALAGSGNVDRIAYGQNIVTSSNGNLTYGIELDMDFGSAQAANADIIHKGIYILGFGSAQPLSRALDIEHSGSNFTVGVVIKNAYHAIDLDNVAGGIRIKREFYNRTADATVPLAYGITTEDLADTAEIAGKLPLFSGTMIQNGSTAIYIKRASDDTPTGLFLQFTDAEGNQIFGVDVAGNMGVPNVIAGQMSTGKMVFANELFTYEQITPTHSLRIESADGHIFKIPAMQVN